MAVTLDQYAPYDDGAGGSVTEDKWRTMFSRVVGTGVIRDTANTMNVFADSTGMQVKVDTGEAWIRGHWGSNTAIKTLPIATAHATLARKDRVILRNNFVTNLFEFDVITGTAAASPTPPVLTQNTSMWEISLAIVSVPATDVTIDAAQVSDARHYQDDRPVHRKKTTDKTVTSSTTLSSDTQLSWPLSADAAYEIEGYLVFEGVTGADAKLNLSAPGTNTGYWSGVCLDTATPGFAGNFDGGAVAIASTFGVGCAGTGIPVAANVRGSITMGEVGGPLTVQFAQNAANATGTILRTGSWIRCTRMVS